MIRIAGTQVPLSAVAELVRRMNGRDEARLAHTLGRAIDAGKTELSLPQRDRNELLLTIQRHPIDGLEPLVAALRGTTDGHAGDGQADGIPSSLGAQTPDLLAPAV